MKFFLTLLPLLAFAAPQGLQVISGSAEVVGGEVRVTESSVLHWDSYSIAAHEHIHYPSPHPTLNRVTSDLPSEIYGHLSSNGPLWLINPNGIVIGENGRINAASFLASTLDLLDGPEFIFAGDRGRIEHHGVIECPGGYVTLLSAESVMQTGEIRAEKVAIGVGREILFTPKDSPLIAIRQSGLEKPGFAAGIQCKGLIEATGLEERGGEVYLVAERVVVEKETMLRGNDVRVLGKEVAEFYGEIEAPGGFAEVSGKELKYRGKTDLRAEDGTFGTLLLDPVTVTISTSSTADATIGDPTTFSADTATINNTDLQTALGIGNVLIDARNAAGAGNGNITWSAGADISWMADTSLQLIGANVTLNSNISSTSTVDNAFLVDATGSFILTADLSIAGSAGNRAINIVSGTAAASSFNGIVITTNISSSDGNIVLNGTSRGGGNDRRGIVMTGGSITVADGRVLTLIGTSAGSVGQFCDGVRLTGGTITLGSSTGATAILTGVGGGGAIGTNHGVTFSTVNFVMNGASVLRFRDCIGGSVGIDTGLNSNMGVLITGTTKNFSSGEVTFANIVGGGGGGSNNNYGLQIASSFSAPIIRMETEYSTSAIQGGNASGFSNHGIFVSNTLGSTTIASTIDLKGIGGGTGTGSAGIRVTSTVRSALGGTITLDGTGANGSGNANYGIYVAGGTVRTALGALTLTGTPGNVSTENGIRIDSAGTVQSTDAGDISFNPAGSSSIGLGLCTLSSGAAFNFNGPINLTANLPTISASTTATFTDTIDGAFAMNVTANTIDLQGTVGGTTPVGTFSLTAPAGIQVANNISTNNANLTFTGPVSLMNNATMNTGAGAGNISFSSTINGAQNLTLSAGTGTITLSNAVGGTTPLGIVQCTGSQINIANNIATADANLTFTGPVVLTGTSTMNTGSGAGNISFSSTVNGSQDLTLNAGAGTITFGDVVGGTTPLGTFEATASNVFLNADITATQGTFDANVTVMGNPSLKKTPP